MSGAILLAAGGVLWAWAHWKPSAPMVRLAVVVHGLGACMALGRGEGLLDGWSGLAVMMFWLPALPAAFWPQGEYAVKLRPVCCIAAFVSAVWAVSILGSGVPLGSPWAWPHRIFALLAAAAAAGAAFTALSNLRGRSVGLLVGALILTALPLLGPRAATVAAYKDGEALQLNAAIIDAHGTAGVERTLQARVVLPGERPIRQAVVALILLALAVALVRRFAGRIERRGFVEWAAFIMVSAHVLLLASTVVPRTIALNLSDVTDVAHATLELEAAMGQTATVAVAPPPYSSGPASASTTLPLALLALLLCGSAFWQDSSTTALLRAETKWVQAAVILMGGTVATGLVWSNYAWGGPIVPDPKFYAAVIVMGLYGMYFLTQRCVPEYRDVPSWLALIGFGVLLLSMLGPELGWITPTLHHFGA